MRISDPLCLPGTVLLATALLWGCAKEDENPLEEAGTNASFVSISSASVVMMDADGSTVTLQSGGGVEEILSSDVAGGPPPDTSAAVFLAGFHNGTDTLFRLRIGTLEFTGSTPTNAELQAFLAPGTRVLTELLSGTDGVTLEWRDGTGRWFGTSCGSAPGSGSFEITHIASQQIGQEHYVKFRALFSGTFHPCDGNGSDVIVTDGALVLRVNDDA